MKRNKLQNLIFNYFNIKKNKQKQICLKKKWKKNCKKKEKKL